MSETIEVRKYAIYSQIAPSSEDIELTKSIWIDLYNRMEEFLEKENLILVREPKEIDDPYHFFYNCTKEDCEFDHYIDECLEHHPDYVDSIGPFHLIGLIFYTIPKKFEKYKEYFKQVDTVVIRNEQ